jgi:hypothetical protein
MLKFGSSFVTKVTYFHMVAVVTDVNAFAFVSREKSVFTHHFIMVIKKVT